MQLSDPTFLTHKEEQPDKIKEFAHLMANLRKKEEALKLIEQSQQDTDKNQKLRIIK